MPTFTCNDPSGEVPEDSKQRIEDLSEEIIEVSAEIAESADEALHALCAASAFVLSGSVSSKENAVNSLQMMVKVILECLSEAEKDGNVRWQQNRHH